MKYLLTLFCALSVGAASSQGVMTFSEKTHDFGTVSEGDVASHTFEFTNTGDQPIVLSQVKASCGCTTPFWTKTPVPPGGTGTIKASYNSRGRLGAFNKSITVTSNAATPVERVFIKGNVTHAAPTYSASELANSPRFVLATKEHHFGKIEIGQAAVARLSVTNEGKEPLKISRLESGCRCVSYELPGGSVAPGATAALKFTYQPRNTRGVETVRVFTNDRHEPIQTLTFKAEVVESFSSQMMRNERSAAPFK